MCQSVCQWFIGEETKIQKRDRYRPDFNPSDGPWLHVRFLLTNRSFLFQVRIMARAVERPEISDSFLLLLHILGKMFAGAGKQQHLQHQQQQQQNNQ